MSVFSDRLKQLRLDKGEKQSDVAAILGVSVQSYSAYEGSREPKYDLLCKIAEHYDVTTDYLLGMSDAKKPENADVMGVTGLSEKAVETLKYCLERSRYNSITLTVNTLLENRYVLGEISHYLYYNIHESDDLTGELTKAIPFNERYKYQGLTVNQMWGDDAKAPIDCDVNIRALTNGSYKKLLMLRIQERLEKLLEQEDNTNHFEK